MANESVQETPSAGEQVNVGSAVAAVIGVVLAPVALILTVAWAQHPSREGTALFLAALLVVIFDVAALISLGRRRLPETARAVWALVILLVPYFGALGYFLASRVQPTDRADDAATSDDDAPR